MDISQVAALLRPVCREVFNGKGKLCLSATNLKKLNDAFEANIPEDSNVSFHIVQTSNAKANFNRDLQFLLDLVQRTVNLKLIPDVVEDSRVIDITKFNNIKILEIHKLDTSVIVGIQKLRSQLQELTCSHNINCLSDIIDKCGGDKSDRYSWNDLKKANFAYNNIVELDDSLECMLSLHTLDLSHNQLKNISFINELPNLKYLNLAYNKLDAVPRFKGSICNRLQVLILNNNFIEDLIGLTSLSNVIQLDLNQNCLLDHKVLYSISHLPSLQWLNLQGNPISFHPHHRNITCNYLNKNSSTLKFVLDNVPLNKTEKTLTGSLYPISQTPLLAASSHNSLEDSANSSIQEKSKRIRNVTIQDNDDADGASKEGTKLVATSPLPSEHLRLKQQVEQLREEYGESWLHCHSGLLVQDVLGFQKTSILSSTPYESLIDSLSFPQHSREDMTSTTANFETAKDESTSMKDDNFKTANDDSAIFNTEEVQDDSDLSDSDDNWSGGEESIYLVTTKPEDEQVFVVLTETHISEKDVTTSKERARWHLNTVRSCQKLEESQHVIKIEFDTVRRDRKQRIYEVDPNEIDSFYSFVQEKCEKTQKLAQKKITYQCMRCSGRFPEQNKNALLDGPSVTCPKCKSNLVIESV